MTVIAFSIDGVARGQGRPRATVKGGFASVYKDGPDRKYEAGVAGVARRAMAGREPLEGPLSLTLRFRLQPPKSMTKGLRARVLAGEEPYFGAFDTSNMVKSIEDAMNKIVWVDDRQVVRLFATKVAAEQAGVDVRVESYEAG
jgi:Holliday junction resolvase RusA-like endonuclease